jgi:DNA-directed RNA polymerase beta subunit
VRVPELGDKMCSRMGQKGVVGMLIPQENMPYTKDGIIPDIIINPHAIPSRMTIAHLLETVLGKAASCKGTMVDGTPFNNNDYTWLYDMLEKDFELERYGNEIMYNGQTGHQIESDIFIGPVFYERLKHMVADKINYRQVNMRTIHDGKKSMIMKDAPVTIMTRQPTKGKGNNGGLRIGEMERDSILSHGMQGFLRESLMERSDKYEFFLDQQSQTIAHAEASLLDNPSKLSTPYAYKQLVHELMAMGINTKMITDEDEANAMIEEEAEDPDAMSFEDDEDRVNDDQSDDWEF